MRVPDFDSAEDCISFGRKTALLTFLIGSSILAAYYLFNHSSLIFLSLFFMVSAFFVNSFIFIKLAVCWFNNPESRKKISNTMLLLILNIPIAYAYIEIGLQIYSSSFSLH